MLGEWSRIFGETPEPEVSVALQVGQIYRTSRADGEPDHVAFQRALTSYLDHFPHEQTGWAGLEVARILAEGDAKKRLELV
jgi:hypothetical protein